MPHWPDFQPHLACDQRRDCLGGEDERDCPYRRCRHGGLAITDRCYFPVTPDTALSWIDAQLGCRRYGAHLASLTSPGEWYDVMRWLRTDTDRGGGWHNALYVGLASVTSEMPHMYVWRRVQLWM